MWVGFVLVFRYSYFVFFSSFAIISLREREREREREGERGLLCLSCILLFFVSAFVCVLLSLPHNAMDWSVIVVFSGQTGVFCKRRAQDNQLL